jgi:serine/threonine protein kinase
MSAAVDDFLRTILRSGILRRDELQDALRSVPSQERDDPNKIADHLVRRGKLTQFQTQKLLQGVSGGLILGPYQVEAVLGRGGMGSVYLALDARSGQHVALKVLPPKMAREKERSLARFEREKTVSQRIRHPNIALTQEAGVTHGVHYIAMEYIPGQTLYRLVTKEGPLLVSRAGQLFAEVADALDYAHSQGVIHRDLKPSNIMVTPNDHAKILDLGLAFLVGEEVEDVEVVGGKGYVVGSVDYMAPEQTRDSSAVDPRTDIYALGCCIYFALTGKPVFPAGGTKEKIQAHRQMGPEPIVNRNPQVPDGFDDVVHRMLAKDPVHRYQTAAEAARELRRWAGGGSSLPIESTGDATYQEAVHKLVTAMPALEGGASDDALVFRIDPPADASSTNLAESLFTDPETGKPGVPKYFWWLIAAFIAFWAFASCLVVFGLVLKWLLAR